MRDQHCLVFSPCGNRFLERRQAFAGMCVRFQHAQMLDQTVAGKEVHRLQLLSMGAPSQDFTVLPVTGDQRQRDCRGQHPGQGLSPAERNLLLLACLPPGAPRTARFVCVLALLPVPEGRALVASGSVEGSLVEENRGEGGFGYDPVFLPAGHALTFGQMPSARKHGLSHRGRACAGLLRLLRP